MPKPKGRANGEGSIFKRPRNGKTVWHGEIVLGWEEGKKQILRSPGMPKQSDARDWITEQLGKQAKGQLVKPTKTTVEDYLNEWLQTVAPLNCKATTLNTYSYILRQHLIPTLGATEMAKLTAPQIQRLYHDKLTAGLNPLTVRSIHMVLHKALSHAAEQDMIPANPADKVKRPKVQKREMQVLTPEQGARFLEMARDDRLHALYVVALYLGLRLGELLGLRWSDVDFEAGTITIRQTINYIGKGEGKGGDKDYIINTPKSDKSRRTLHMPDDVVKALRKWRVDQGKERLRLGGAWAEGDFVFTSEIGTPLRPSNIHRRSFQRLLDLADCPRIRFHDLRHTAITAMGAMGLSPREAQELAGHSDVSTTLGTYGHVWKEQKEAAAKRINSFWSQDRTGKQA